MVRLTGPTRRRQIGIHGGSADGFHRQVEATVQRHVRGLRLRSQRGGKYARDCDSDELFIHGVSPLTDKIGKVSSLLRLPSEPSLIFCEKFDPFCQTVHPTGKPKAEWGSGMSTACCAEATEKRGRMGGLWFSGSGLAVSLSFRSRS
jgi:hypothetical protein